MTGTPPAGPAPPDTVWDRLKGALPRLIPGAVLVASLWSLAGDLIALGGLLRPATWRALTHPENPRYHPLWSWVLMSEFAMTVLLLLACIALLALLLARHPRFPALMSGLLGVNLAWAVADWLAVRVVSGSLAPGAEAAVREAAAANVYIALALTALIPYLLHRRAGPAANSEGVGPQPTADRPPPCD